MMRRYKIVRIDGRQCENKFVHGVHDFVYNVYVLVTRKKWWLFGEKISYWEYRNWFLTYSSAKDAINKAIAGPKPIAEPVEMWDSHKGECK